MAIFSAMLPIYFTAAIIIVIDHSSAAAHGYGDTRLIL
jgi:hypothetical protein